MELAGSVRSPNAGLEGSECCHMLDLTGASSKCAEQRDSNHELRALAEGVHTGATCKCMSVGVESGRVVKRWQNNKNRIGYNKCFCMHACVPMCLRALCVYTFLTLTPL